MGFYMANEKSDIRAFLYLRVSTVEQESSIKLQEQNLKEYCQGKGWQVAGIFRDFGKSGKDTKGRPEFMRMMDLIEASELPPCEMVLCTKLDRFARSLVDLDANITILNQHDIKFSTLQMDFETVTPIGKFLVNTLGNFAEFERAIINERTREGYEAAKAAGVICNRPKITVNRSKALDLIFVKGLSAGAAGKVLGVSTGTMKNRLNEWGYYYQNGEWIRPSAEEWVKRSVEE